MSIPQSGGGPIERHEQLAEYLAAGCKPKDDWRIGTEHEKFGYCKDTLKPLPYDGDRSIRAMLEGLRDGFGWDPVLEGDHIIGLVKDGANVSLEPGGQLELSGAPLETIHQTCDEVNDHLRDVKTVADKIGARFIGLGAAPIWTHDADAADAQGPLQADGCLHAKGRHPWHADDAPDLHGSGEPRFRVRGRHGAEDARGAGAAAGGDALCSPIRRSSRASSTATSPGARGSGATWIPRAPACCPLCSRTASGLSNMPTRCSMCRCISSTATANTSTRWASRSAIS